MFAYLVSIGLLLLAAINVVLRSEWYLSVGLAACGVVGILAFGRPLFRTAIHRTSTDEVVCRFVPWYHASSLATALLVPMVGIAMIAAGRAPGNPAWLRYGGYFALLLGIAFVLIAIVQSTNRLSFTPSMLVVRIGRQFEIPRERFISIKAKSPASVGTGKAARHYDLVYEPPGGGSNRVMASVDMQFSVEPANLAAALQAWGDADPNHPGLMDLVESILRGSSPTES